MAKSENGLQTRNVTRDSTFMIEVHCYRLKLSLLRMRLLINFNCRPEVLQETKVKSKLHMFPLNFMTLCLTVKATAMTGILEIAVKDRTQDLLIETKASLPLGHLALHVYDVNGASMN